MLGSKSGYDSVEECFEDLTPHIFALETGLSSDPPMNWRVSNLDRYTLVSSSDAHSPPKLAREATLFDIEPSYDALFAALKSGDPTRCLGTLEFFPEEGKYHHDGHRKCNINWKPAVTLEHGGICSVCGKPVTVGVGHRVEVLADRAEGYRKPNAHPFYSLIPLPEIISELVGVGPNSKRVQQEYQRLLAELGPELAILLDLPTDEIAKVGGEKLASGIGRMRRGDVNAIAGYDGEYGIIKLFDGDEEDAAPQMSLFEEDAAEPKSDAVVEPPPSYVVTAIAEEQYPIPNIQYPAPDDGDKAPVSGRPTTNLLTSLNADQRTAATCTDRPLIIVAGPGTGKTRTLTTRIAYLIQENGCRARIRFSPSHSPTKQRARWRSGCRTWSEPRQPVGSQSRPFTPSEPCCCGNTPTVWAWTPTSSSSPTMTAGRWPSPSSPISARRNSTRPSAISHRPRTSC